MAYTEKKIQRTYIGKDFQDVMELPDLIDIQLSSYERFLQRERLRKGEALENVGLEEVFRVTFPIESPNGDMLLEYERYYLDESAMKYSEIECKQKGLTYAVPLKARINLVFQKTGEIRQKEIYLGDVPLMTDRGTFIINGAECVVVSQIHRSPGVIFCHEKGVYSARIIPYRGSWLEFEIDQKKELIYAKIDRKKRILGTMFLRSLGFETREDINRIFQATDPNYVGFCLDTGHIVYGQTDPIDLIRDYPERIDYVHIKAMDPGLVKQAHDDDWPFGLAVAKGCSVAPPDGEPKMPGLIEALAGLDKELYVITEQDMYPCDPSYPLPNAIKTREYLAECGLGVK